MHKKAFCFLEVVCLWYNKGWKITEVSELSISTIILKLVLAIVISSLIGFDREFKNRPAGIRTHNLVCLGAVVIAMVQKDIAADAIRIAMEHPEIKGTIRSDESRLIAQIVSGIGFLGAGTIIITKQQVKGLTTAASLWVTAGIGIAIGMGYYSIAICSAVLVVVVLSLLNKVIHVHALKKIEIQYKHRIETKEFLSKYFEANQVIIRDVDFAVDTDNDVTIYTNYYTVELPHYLTYAEMIENLSLNKNIVKIRMVDV